MTDIVIGELKKNRTKLLTTKARIMFGRHEFQYAFDYFMDDFGTSLHNRPINKECCLVNPKVSGLPTNYPQLNWYVTQGRFMLHQTQDIQEGLCGLEHSNYAFFNSQWIEGTILVDVWFGAVGSWVSVIMRQLEARYVVVADGTYEWEKEIRLDLYHNGELLWESPITQETNILNSFPLGITSRDKGIKIASTNSQVPIEQITNFVWSPPNPVGVGSSASYKDGQFTGVAGVYFFGGTTNLGVHL